MGSTPKRPARRPPGSGPSRGRSRPGAGRRGSAASEPSGRTGSFTTRAAILGVVVLLLFASYTSSLHAWWEQRGEIQSTRAEIAMRKDAISDMRVQQKRWEDEAFVKQQARERFGWVMPGEVGYRVIGSDGEVQGEVPELAEPAQPQEKQWYDALWGTVVEAGKKPEEKKKATPDPDKVIEREKTGG